MNLLQLQHEIDKMSPPDLHAEHKKALKEFQEARTRLIAITQKMGGTAYYYNSQGIHEDKEFMNAV